MSGPRLLRLRRFGNVAARDAALRELSREVSTDVAVVQGLLDAGRGPFSAPLVPELRSLGWDAHELILGVDAVRVAWEREHGPVPEAPGIRDPDALLALAEAERLQPDVILDSNLNVLHQRGREAFRRVAPSVRVFAGYAGTEKRFHRAIGLDLLLVPCVSIAQAVRPFARGQVEVLPHSFNQRVLDNLPKRSVAHPLTFAGVLGPKYVERHRVLMALLQQTELEAWVGLRKGVERSDDGWLVAASSGTQARRVRERLMRLIPTQVLAAFAARTERLGPIFNQRIAQRSGGRLVQEVLMRDPAADFPLRCHPPIGGVEYLQLLRSSGTVVHRGIDALGDCGGALRLFEVTGVGATLLLEDSSAVRELFEVGEEVITYRDAEDAVKKARWLTENPDERERIAAAGQQRTLRDHTTTARARTLDPILRSALVRQGSRSRRVSGA